MRAGGTTGHEGQPRRTELVMRAGDTSFREGEKRQTRGTGTRHTDRTEETEGDRGGQRGTGRKEGDRGGGQKKSKYMTYYSGQLHSNISRLQPLHTSSCLRRFF